MDKISIITVTYNAASTLENAILSVIKQDYPCIEFIIIDGNSKDSTIEIIKKYENKIAYWISEKDNGIYDAMNKGIAKATGDRVIFLGADDCFISNQIFSAVFSGKTYDAIDFLYGNVQLRSSKKILGGERNYETLLDQNISHQAIFYKKSVFEKKGKFNLRYKVLADYYYNIELFRDDTLVKKFIPVIITLYNDRGITNTNIDIFFYQDMIQQLLKKEQWSKKTPSIQHYFFYNGFYKISKGQLYKGFIEVFHSLIFTKKKGFYFLLAIKFLLSFAGIGKKMSFK